MEQHNFNGNEKVQNGPKRARPNRRRCRPAVEQVPAFNLQKIADGLGAVIGTIFSGLAENKTPDEILNSPAAERVKKIFQDAFPDAHVECLDMSGITTTPEHECGCGDDCKDTCCAGDVCRGRCCTQEFEEDDNSNPQDTTDNVDGGYLRAVVECLKENTEGFCHLMYKVKDCVLHNFRDGYFYVSAENVSEDKPRVSKFEIFVDYSTLKRIVNDCRSGDVIPAGMLLEGYSFEEIIEKDIYGARKFFTSGLIQDLKHRGFVILDENLVDYSFSPKGMLVGFIPAYFVNENGDKKHNVVGNISKV